MISVKPATLLGISVNSDFAVVKKAYLNRVKVLHPDRFDSTVNADEWLVANQMLQELNREFEMVKSECRSEPEKDPHLRESPEKATPKEFYADLKKTATRRGYKPGWAFHAFVAEYNRKPTREELGEPKPDPATYYQEMRQLAEERGHLSGWAYYRFKDEFGRGPTPKEMGKYRDY